MDRHQRAAAAFVRICGATRSVLGVLAYGSFARGDYTARSDIDFAVFLDSRRFSEADAKKLVTAIARIQAKYHVVVEADFILDSEIELFNRGILLDGRAFSDRRMYMAEGKVLYGEDLRGRFTVPRTLGRLGGAPLILVEEHFKRWLLGNLGRRVPWWFPAWALTVAVNLRGATDVVGREEMLSAVERLFPRVRRLREYRKVRAKPREAALRGDEFLALLRGLERDLRS